MAESKFETGAKSGFDIKKMTSAELCEFAAQLCKTVSDEVGGKGCRGGIYPENISFDENGKISIGPAKSGDWAEEELRFIAPELYWHGNSTQSADVYSVGMLLYYAVSGGELPFAESENAQLRRMGGERFDAPEKAGRRLSEIISKATAFNASERYQNLDELRLELESCEKNIYIDEEKGAGAIFNKDEGELSDIERMMVGIIEGDNEEESPAEESAEEICENETEELEEEKETAGGKNEEPAEKPETPEVTDCAAEEESNTQPETEEKEEPAPIPAAEEKSEFEPFITQTPIIPAVQYSKSLERERKIAEEVKKRRRRPMMFILVCCALLIVSAIIANAVMNDAKAPPAVSSSPAPTAQSVNANTGPIEMPPAENDPLAEGEGGQPSGEAEPTPTVQRDSRYQIVKEDLSWTEARDRCIEMGGHLAVIEDMAEYDRIVKLASEQDANKLWIGCSRVNGELVWVNGGEASYYPWAEGEPSLTDSLDGAAEDYIMLWNNEGWYLNDSRNDPIDQYPQWYSGTIGFICEFEE